MKDRRKGKTYMSLGAAMAPASSVLWVPKAVGDDNDPARCADGRRRRRRCCCWRWRRCWRCGQPWKRLAMLLLPAALTASPGCCCC